jgi:hypothetical protein
MCCLSISHIYVYIYVYVSDGGGCERAEDGGPRGGGHHEPAGDQCGVEQVTQTDRHIYIYIYIYYIIYMYRQTDSFD